MKTRLPYREPWHWEQFQQHFQLRLLGDIERLEENTYTRSFDLDGRRGWFSVRALADSPALELEIADECADLMAQVSLRVRRMFDLDSDPQAIAGHLGRDPQLVTLLQRAPGLRLPSAFDPFEQAVRAIVGQQVSVKAATTISGRLVGRLGTPLPGSTLKLFPSAAALAEDALENIGMPGKRAQCLRHFAGQVASGALSLDLDDGVEGLRQRLCALPGIGPWTAEYIALRALGARDAFPASDLGLLRAPVWGGNGLSPAELNRRAEAWRPWRAYAAAHLWNDYSHALPLSR